MPCPISEFPNTFTEHIASLVLFHITTQVILRLNTSINIRTPLVRGSDSKLPHCENIILVTVKFKTPTNSSEHEDT